MSSAFFIIPLFLFITYTYWRERRVDNINILLANLLGLVVTALWVIPLLNSVGGVSEYLRLYDTHNPMPAIGIVKNIVGFSSYALSFGIPFFIIGIYQLLTRKNKFNVEVQFIFHSNLGISWPIIFYIWSLFQRVYTSNLSSYDYFNWHLVGQKT